MFDPRKPPPTLAVLAQRSFVEHESRRCLGFKPKGADSYQYLTYGEVAAHVRKTACGLLSLGIERGARIAILSENRPEWAITDLACQMLGVISVSLFSTLPANHVEYILRDSGATAVVVSTAAQLKKITAIRDNLHDLKHVIITDDGALDKSVALSLAALEQTGEAFHRQDAAAYETAWPAALPDDVATLIYTSGTTGEPKGVMLTHRNLISNVEALLPLLDWSIDDLFLSFLPLAHVYERSPGYYLPLRLGACIAYCESLFTVDKNLREVRPTIMFCVPRLLESMAEKMRDAANSLPEAQQSKYEDALALAEKAGAEQGKLSKAQPLSLVEKVKYKVYDAKVYAKIREKCGGRLRAFVSGGAPLSPETGALFTGLSLAVWEGYGLTETSPVIAVNRPGRVHLGTVGEVLESVEVRIDEDGEILVRGDSVMKGYWAKPEATAEAIDSEGWFHTGDIGTLQDNYLKITDRKKDLLVLANGKKVAPVPIEMKLLHSKLIAQVVLLGDKQKAVTAIIVPNMEALKAMAQNVNAANDEELLKSAEIRKLVRDEIDAQTNDVADYEKVKGFALLATPFSIENGELTPTLKIKRRVVAEKYGSLLN